MARYLTIREAEGKRQILKKLFEEPVTGSKLPIIGLIQNSLRDIAPLELIIDKWPDFSTIILKNDFKKLGLYGMESLVYLYSTKNEVLDSMLATPGVIPWHLPLLFAAIPKPCVPSLEKAIKSYSKGGALKTKDEFYLFNYTNVLPKKGSLPEGYRIRPLAPSDAEFMNSTWSYGGGKDRIKFIEFILKTQCGYCLENSNGEIVVVSGRATDSSFGMGWTHPDYRRSGLMQYLFTHVLNEAVKRKDSFNFGLVHIDNHVSRKAVIKSGAPQEEGTVFYLYYNPPSQIRTETQSKL